MNVFFSSRRRHTRWPRDWSSDVCSSDLFDLLELDGQPLVDLQLTERRARLEQLLDRRSTSIRLSETFEDGDALLEAAREQRLEEIGRASCRERGKIRGVGGGRKQKDRYI